MEKGKEMPNVLLNGSILSLFFLPILAGCATKAGFESRMSAYIGRSESELVASLGVPARTYEAEGRRFLQYERRKIVGESMGGWGWAGGYTVQTWDCNVTFELVNHVVESFSSRGNDCVATPP